MCFIRRHLYVCGHEIIRNGMCPEAENRGKFGACESGYHEQSDKGLPVEERSFCPECPCLSLPSKEEREKQRHEREIKIKDCKEELDIAIKQPEGNLLENRRAIGEAAYNVAFYTEKDRWQEKVENLEKKYYNDAERLKEGRDRLLDEFDNNVEDIRKDQTMFNEDMGALLARAGCDQATHLPNWGYDREFALDNKW